MSWFSERWRTQQIVINSANRKISDSSNFWTHIALRLRVEDVSFSVFSNLLYSILNGIGFWVPVYLHTQFSFLFYKDDHSKKYT
jgi:hypothetical protein